MVRHHFGGYTWCIVVYVKIVNQQSHYDNIISYQKNVLPPIWNASVLLQMSFHFGISLLNPDEVMQERFKIHPSHFTNFSPKVDSSCLRPQSSWSFSWLPAFNENPVLLSEINSKWTDCKLQWLLNTIHRMQKPAYKSSTITKISLSTKGKSTLYKSVARDWLCAARGLSWLSLLIGLEKNMNSSLSLRQAALKFFKLSRASPLIWGFFVNQQKIPCFALAFKTSGHEHNVTCLAGKSIACKNSGLSSLLTVRNISLGGNLKNNMKSVTVVRGLQV